MSQAKYFALKNKTYLKEVIIIFAVKVLETLLSDIIIKFHANLKLTEAANFIHCFPYFREISKNFCLHGKDQLSLYDVENTEREQ